MWQLAAIALVAPLLGVAILASEPDPVVHVDVRERRWPTRLGLAALALLATVAIGIPFGTTAAIRSSQADVSDGNLSAALDAAATAQRLEPYAASPRLQRALILERSGDLRDARAAIAQATARESTDWSIWLVRARIDAESGHEAAAAGDYRRAHELNPLSPTTAYGGAELLPRLVTSGRSARDRRRNAGPGSGRRGGGPAGHVHDRDRRPRLSPAPGPERLARSDGRLRGSVHPSMGQLGVGLARAAGGRAATPQIRPTRATTGARSTPPSAPPPRTRLAWFSR